MLDISIDDDIKGKVYANTITEDWIEIQFLPYKLSKLKAYLLLKWVYGVSEIKKENVKEIRPKMWGTKSKSCAKNLSTWHYNEESYIDRMSSLKNKHERYIKHESRVVIWNINQSQ